MPIKFMNTMSKTLAFLSILLIASCNSVELKDKTLLENIPAGNETIYEVNIRQYSKDGDFASFQKHLPRLKDLGVNILWLMPIHPIGERKRKAYGDIFAEEISDSIERAKFLGSPYAVKNYREVNPDFGTIEEFKSLVDHCHELGIKVIIDWVANHTAWDNPWIENHPDWYTYKNGEITDPLNSNGESEGWTDVADLNYEKAAMRQEMINSMKFWVQECDIDGFRCDVAYSVPASFWEEARAQLEAYKPLFMLAEAEAHNLDLYNKAFDAFYGWELHHKLNALAKKEIQSDAIHSVVIKNRKQFSGRAFRMNFITNHDENSWNGSEYERMGNNWEKMAILTFALPGMPLIYSGQENSLNHRLKFFEKDLIDWSLPEIPLYKTLCKYKNEGYFGSNEDTSYQPLKSSDLFGFQRNLEKGKLTVLMNFGEKTMEIPTEWNQGKTLLGAPSNEIKGGAYWIGFTPHH